ncbi:major facilitator superfamily domain-containing protein [Aspergillus undulatus]|uniref:major facilitator superfamily domain-containing protein n=1 Tax=Aspergillus undulatus TaxID=1810928 RepID=UPI003CCCE8F5
MAPASPVTQEGEKAPEEGPLDAVATNTTDPAPYSIFTKAQKRYIVFAASWAGFFSPVSSQIYFPALNSIADDLGVTTTLINLTLTSYMIFQGLAPMFVGDFADKAGRRPAYLVCFVIYLAANIGLALQDSFAALFVLRCLQSAGSSATIALSAGVVSDIAVAAERGSYMGFVTAGSLLGPAMGPVIGGLLSQYLGWRSVFWFLTIFAGAFMVPFVLFFPETARAIVGNGSIPPQKWNMSLISWFKARTTTPPEELDRPRLRFPNPTRTIAIVFQKDIGIILFANAILFAGFYDVSASITTIYSDLYGLDDLQIGLCYLPFGLGATVASIATGKMLDFNYRRLAKRLNVPLHETRARNLTHFPIEKARLQVALPLLTLGTFTIIAFGWCLHFGVHVAAPTTILFFMGLCLTGSFNTVGTMLVDFYPMNAAAATASNNFVRCLLGAGATALIDPMLKAMGRGWCFTFIALVMLLTTPLLWVVIRQGPRWRKERQAKIDSVTNTIYRHIETTADICYGLLQISSSLGRLQRSARAQMYVSKRSRRPGIAFRAPCRYAIRDLPLPQAPHGCDLNSLGWGHCSKIMYSIGWNHRLARRNRSREGPKRMYTIKYASHLQQSTR